MRISRVTQLSLGFALAMMIANVTFAQNVKTDFNKSTDFSGYKTFMWIKEPNTTNPLLKQRVVDDVNAVLTARGLQLVTSNADLGIAAHTATKEQNTLNTFYDGFGGGWRWGGGFGSATTMVNTYEVGTLVVDMFDSRTKEAIWRGRPEDALGQSAEERGEPEQGGVEDVQELSTGGEESELVATRVMTAPVSNAFIAVGAVMITFGGARAADAFVLRVVHPPGSELLFISDAVLSTAFGIAVYLWLNLSATRTRLTDLERAQLVTDTQLSLAAQIQDHLLPRVPAESNGVLWAARLEPAYRVGGDFYDVLPGEGDSLFVVGDVSGKGIPAALLQASAHALFRTFARETRDPAELLTRVSKEIYSENAGESYLTCLLVRINSATRTMMYTMQVIRRPHGGTVGLPAPLARRPTCGSVPRNRLRIRSPIHRPRRSWRHRNRRHHGSDRRGRSGHR